MRKSLNVSAIVLFAILAAGAIGPAHACTESWDCRMNPPCQGCVNYAESIRQYCYSHNKCDTNDIFYTICAQEWEKSCDYQYCADVAQCEDYFWVPGVNALMTPADPLRVSCVDAPSPVTTKPAA